MSYNLADWHPGCQATIAAGATSNQRPVQNLLGRIHDIEEHDRMTHWLHQRQRCRARRP
ncbi:hypothetical protein [Cupriavidus nantongensis]|uniref:hypothetical protein n=1 Tax=Cupriavidus nantongensis TaxID=1796606 RepID=UPI0012B69637|nr:hypothetical protein [Cupriavidus nantongensis]